MKRFRKVLMASGALILLVAGCATIAGLHSDLNVADVNARNAIYMSEKLTRQMSNLEDRVDELEERLGE